MKLNLVKEVEIMKLIPNNLYLNGDKIEKIKKGYDRNKILCLPPILVGIIDNEMALIDGHSRTWVAYNNGKTTIKAIIQPIEEMGDCEELYRRIHEIAKENKILDISCLSNRIVYGEEHEEKWVGFCNEIIKGLENK